MSVTEVTPEVLRAWPLPPVTEDADKESRGRVLVIGGGREVAGAVLLAGLAALRAGSGKLQIGAPAEVATALAIACPEARVFPLPQTRDGELAAEAAGPLEEALGRCDAAVIGPGMLDAGGAGELAKRLLAFEGPAMVVDAAAMPALARSPEHVRPREGRLILTPHAGEMAQLTGRSKAEVEADPLDAARDLAARLKAVVALKGPETMIVSPDGNAWRNVGGCPGLATSGSGDVLAGLVAGLLARGASPLQATVWGSYAHGACGRCLAERIAPVGFLARELPDQIPGVLAELAAPAA